MKQYIEKQDFNNPYQYTRAINFKALQNPDSTSDCFEESIKQVKNNNSKIAIKNLAEGCLGFYKDIFDIFFRLDEKKMCVFKKKLQINKTWLKRWHKNIFYLLIRNDRNKQGKYSLQDLESLRDHFEKWFDEGKEYSKKLKQFSELLEENQSRRSDIATAIQNLSSIKNMDCAIELLNALHTQDPQISEKIEHLIYSAKSLQEELRKAKQSYLPTKSAGIEIAKASFNYYTVNKQEKEYQKKLIEAKQKLYETACQNLCFDKKYIKTDQEKAWLKKWLEKNNYQDVKSLTLDETYKIMKSFKAEQKDIFYKCIEHIANDKKDAYVVNNNNFLLYGYKLDCDGYNVESVNKLFSLFQFTDKKIQNVQKTKIQVFEDFKNLTKNIQVKDNKNTRGQNLFGKDCYFKAYGDFCEAYKCVAQKRGKLIAQIKGIEKEQKEAMQTAYWALIYAEKDSKQLWLVPKETMQKAKNFIYNENGRKTYEKDEQNHLCCFESLTMRALHKLCFAEQSSFVEGLPGELKTLQTEVKKSETEEKANLTLAFFKAVLKSEYALKNLNLQSFDLIALDEANNLDDFEKTLEEVCYHVRRIVITSENKQYFLQEFNTTVLNITSYDLEGRNKNTHQTPPSENKYHTDLWQKFWTSMDKNTQETVKGFKVGKVRLNPEVKIRYRQADMTIKKYFCEFPSNFKHRRHQEQLGINFTFSINAGKKYEDLAFSKPEDILKKIKKFNEELNQTTDFKNMWRYGIDRGNIELATLCLTKFTESIDNGKTIVKPTFPDGKEDIKCYRLKDYTYSKPHPTPHDKDNQRKAIVNLSYFMDQIEDENLFEKTSVSCLDLTTAKVIKGKIIENGDVMTFLKLKKMLAKRHIHNFYYKKQISTETLLEWCEYENGNIEKKRKNGVLNLKTEEGEKTIYTYAEKYKDIVSKDTIKKNLNRYLSELREQKNQHTPSIEQINNLRDAITANMVGVIFHLQKKYQGFVFLEDLEKNIIENHFSKSNANISRRLEWRLYNKFQSMGLVPPHVKDIITLREDLRNTKGDNKYEKSSQIGAIVFVDKKNTSKDCPYCGETNSKSSKEFKKDKFENNLFDCPKCSFNTKDNRKGLDDLDDTDKIAAFNIAKKIIKPDDIAEMAFSKQNNNNKRK